MLPLHRELEECAFRALPALHTERRDGWVVRLSGGGPKRANSINIVAASTEPLAGKIAACEHLFASQGIGTTFRITSHELDPGLDAMLAAAGYEKQDESIVMTRVLDVPLRHEAIAELAPTEWLALLHEIDQGSAERKQKHTALLAQLAQPALYGAVEHGGRRVAMGLAVLDGRHAGLFDVATLPDARRTGHARRLTLALLEGARQRGAELAYLQVVASNQAATKLYAALGFVESYRYWYRARA